MTARQSPLTSVGSALAMAVLVAAWIVLAPTHFGGQASYVLVVGNSMEPRLHRGDLVVIRAEPEYAIGDVVTYLHPQIGPVIHRIVERQGERFVFKGDNNSWLDSYQPARPELLGKLWFDLPLAGTLLEQLRSPGSFGVLAALAAMVATGSVMGGTRARRPLGRTRPRSENGNPQLGGSMRLGEQSTGALSAVAAGAVLCALLVVYAFSQPIQRTVSDDVSYEHGGAFSYSAPVPSGSAYDSDTVTTGEPVFRRLASQVSVRYAYGLNSDRPHDVAGATTLQAVVSDANGWRRTLPLQAATSFVGATAMAEGTLDLDRVQRIIDALQAEAGVQRSEYALTIVADVEVHGRVAGRELSDQHNARLLFRLDPLQLQLAPTGRESDPLRSSQVGVLRGFRVEPNSLALLSLRLDVGAVRATALACLGIALLAAAAVGLGLWRTARGDEPARIQAKYGAHLLAVRVAPLTSGVPAGVPAGVPMVDVATIDDLARLAERTGRVILHSAAGDRHTYILQDGDVNYRYQTALGPDAASAVVPS